VVKLVLPCDDDEGTAEAFLCWLQQRASAVESLSIDIQETAVGAQQRGVAGRALHPHPELAGVREG
jgi:hypothetical protein